MTERYINTKRYVLDTTKPEGKQGLCVCSGEEIAKRIAFLLNEDEFIEGAMADLNSAFVDDVVRHTKIQP